MLRILSVGPRLGEAVDFSSHGDSCIGIFIAERTSERMTPKAAGSDSIATMADASLSIEGSLPERTVDRVLIIRLGALGDVIRTLPAVEGLRRVYPGAHLTWLVEPGAAGVVDAAALVDETMVFPRTSLVGSIRSNHPISFLHELRDFIRRLRDRRFDLTIDFHGILKSGLLARLSGAPIRYGYGPGLAREFSEIFVNRPLRGCGLKSSRYDRNAALVRLLAPGVQLWDRPFLTASPLAEARLTARLRLSGREDERSFVLIHPGTSEKARHKRYATRAWAEVARRLASDGVSVWITSGRGRLERALVDEIFEQAEGTLGLAPETAGFDDLLALLGRASVFASADSGPLHAASLVGVPVVQLLGPTDPIQNTPWPHSPSLRVHVPLPCSPCRRGCPDPACMRVIPPSLVVEKIRRLHSRASQ
jgi:ADP-heptose:LPS heptosyltransferase